MRYDSPTCLTALFFLLLTLGWSDPLRAAPEPGRMYKIGVVQITDNETLNEGFNRVRERLAELGYVKGKNLRIIRRTVLGDTKGLWNQLKLIQSLYAFLDEFIEEKVDLAITATSPAFYFGREKLTEAGIPVVLAGLINPQALGCESAEICGKLVTGVTLYVDPLKIVNLIRTAFPEAKRVCSVSSMDFDARFRLEEYDRLFKAQKDLVFNKEAVASFTGKGFVRVVKNMLPDCDVVIGLPDPIFMVDNYRPSLEIVAMANKAGVPIVSSVEMACQIGGPFALGVGPREHGKITAELAVKVLEGTKPGDLPISRHKHLNFYVNGRAVSYLGLRVPPVILSNAKSVELLPFIKPEEVFPPK